MIGDSNNENNFPHKLLLADRQIERFRKAFANNLPANIELPKKPTNFLNNTIRLLSS